MADQTAGAPAGVASPQPRPVAPIAAATSAPISLAAALLGCLVLAAVSIQLQGFRFAVDNNLFHIPIVLRWYDLPQFADDGFMQSLRRYATPVYPLLSLIATEQNIQSVFFTAHLLTRALTFYALFQAARAMGLRGVWPAAVPAVLCLAAPLYRVSTIGRDELFPALFTHTELAQAVALLAAGWLIRGEPIKAAVAAGLAFDLNLMVGAWMLAPLGLRLVADIVARQRGAVASLIASGAAFTFTAAPEVVWLASTQSFALDFDYAAYLADYYPHHFFIGWAPWSARITLALQVLSALIALWFVPKNRTGAAALLLGLAGVFAAGAVIDQHTGSRLILNLHLLRVDGMLLWSVALIVATGACAALASGRAVLIPGALLGLGALAAGFWPLVFAGMLLLIAGDLATRRRGPPISDERPASVAAPLLALAATVGAAAVFHGGYSALPTSPAARQPPSDDQLLGAAPAAPEWAAVTLWAREHTAPNALFLPPWKLDFEATAKRRSWVGWKQGASAMWAPETYAQWRRRGDEVRALPDARSQLAYACAHGIDYVILDRRPSHALPGVERIERAAYSNRWFTVVSSGCSAPNAPAS